MHRAVLFDWDGTLADTRQVIVATFQKAVREIGVSVNPDFVARQIGTGAEQTFKEILRQANKPLNDKLIKKLLARKIELEIELGNNVKLFPGASSLLEALQGQVRVALASMNNLPVIEHLLKSMKLQECFEVVVTVEDVVKFKPNPEIFLTCAKKLGCPPEECVVVEDSIFGVQAAKAAGMDCIAVLTGEYNRRELETANPGLIVKSLTEKGRILEFILAK